MGKLKMQNRGSRNNFKGVIFHKREKNRRNM